MWAVPARRNTIVVTQPDGSQLELIMRGDEIAHWYADAHGTCMALDTASGWWLPAAVENGAAKTRRLGNEARRAARAQATRAKTAYGSKDKRKALVILSEFTDVKFKTQDVQAVFSEIFNKEGYTGNGSGGSVHDYFLAQSYGQLDISFDVIGPVTVPETMEYYGKNRNGDDIRPATFVVHSIQQADDMTDFSQYDWDGDGEVEQVYIIYAGYSEAYNSNKLANCIWPHEWTLEDARYSESEVTGALKLDGVKINTYACSNELYGTAGSRIEGIGTACHEFSHCIGLPDMYDTNGVAYGMDQWDLMDYGCYNADGYVPASYTAYERWFAGWIEPIVLDEPCDVTGMKNIDEDGECYIIYNNAHKDEYYMLQNIQQTGWNAGAASSGLLVLHIDYNSLAWEYNTVNTSADHQRMRPVCADNSWNFKDNKGDLWPWNGNDALTDESVPKASLYFANDDGRNCLGRPITGIRNENGLVSFCFNGGSQSPVYKARASTASKDIYDLLGRKAKRHSHGIYIQDGHKVVK